MGLLCGQNFGREYATKRFSIKLKDEEAEIKVWETGSDTSSRCKMLRRNRCIRSRRNDSGKRCMLHNIDAWHSNLMYPGRH